MQVAISFCISNSKYQEINILAVTRWFG